MMAQSETSRLSCNVVCSFYLSRRGAFALGATVIGLATSKLKEWNAEMDETEKQNARAINKNESPLARFFRHQDAAKEKSDFERHEVAKNNPITGVSREELTRQARAIEAELNMVRADANSDKVKQGQDTATGAIETLKEKIAKAEKVEKPGMVSWTQRKNTGASITKRRKKVSSFITGSLKRLRIIYCGLIGRSSRAGSL